MAQAAPVAEKKAELRELKGRIDTLRKEIRRGEASRADVTEQLRETERAIGEANRSLRELAQRQQRAQAELNSFGDQIQALERDVGAQQQQLSGMLHRRYLAGEAAGLARLLSGDDPNQIARDLHFFGHLTRAQADLIESLHQSADAKQQLAARARAQSDELAKLAQLEQRARADLVEQERRRKSVLASIADQLRSQRSEVGALKQDEARLTKLIKRLQRSARRAATARKPPRSAAAKPSRRGQADDKAADGADTGSAFARLKGRLSLPVRGELVHRFGAPRSGGGTSWKGLFIHAPGSKVRAVAPGKIVFAEWLRGFGNLLIIDHGGSYLSVYGNNETLFKSVGQNVAAGEAVAAIGSGGDSAQTGLYFEIRHKGQPLDPTKWVNPR